jgi:hypothetical protein
MQNQGADNFDDNIIEGEFDFDRDAGSGVVPIPDELISDELTSYRGSLPDELVVKPYELVTITARPPTEIVKYDPDIANKVLVSLSIVESEHYGYYQSVADTYAPIYPGRFAYLLDLIQRLRASLMELKIYQRRAEQERISLNQRNNFINDRIDDELSRLYERWRQDRRDLEEAIKEIEQKSIDYRMKRQAELDAERNRYHEIRERWNVERDQRDRDESLRLLEEKNQEREAERKRFEIAEEEYANAWKLASEADKLAVEAEMAAFDVAEKTSAQCLQGIEKADAEYNQAFQSVLARFNEEENELIKAAQSVEQSLLEEKRTRENLLHQVEKEITEERAKREQQLIDVRIRGERASASAGLSTKDARFDENLDERLKNRIPTESVSTQANIEHLAFPTPHWAVVILKSIAKFIALIAFGSIFGVSLGLITDFVDFSQESSRDPNLVGKIIGVCVLSIFVFYLIGEAIHHAWVYSEEERHATLKQGKPWGQRYILALGMAGILVFAFVIIEATVERYGIVSVINDKAEMSILKGDKVTASVWKEFAYWAIALVVSVPFAVYHSYAGAMSARYKLGNRAREAELGRRHEELLNTPEIKNAIENNGLYIAAQDRLAKTQDDFEHLLSIHKRRISEIETELVNHPVILRLSDFLNRKQELIEQSPELVLAREVQNAVKQMLENDPVLKVARDRANHLRETANKLQEKAESLRRGGIAGATKDLLEDAIEAGKSRVQNLIPQTPVTLSWEESHATERRGSVRNSIGRDPQIAYNRNRIVSLKAEIVGLDKQYASRRQSLIKQKPPVEPRPVPSPEMQWQIDQAIARVKSTQLLLDEEIQRLCKITDGGAFIRWMHSVHQHLFSRTPMQRRIQATRQLQTISSDRMLPSSLEQPR